MSPRYFLTFIWMARRDRQCRARDQGRVAEYFVGEFYNIVLRKRMYQKFAMFIEEIPVMRMLIPDGTKPQQPDLIWCLPINPNTWKSFELQADQFKCKTKTTRQLRYLVRRNGTRTLIILLKPDLATEDEVMEAGAWLRLVKGFSHAIYIVGHAAHEITTNEAITTHVSSDSRNAVFLDMLTDPEQQLPQLW